ncbi:MAG TPA: universal stress protein [Gemmatimonadaceae bacterium]|nr:universal stress protein [Gemmatimonadaceae bacterium]
MMRPHPNRAALDAVTTLARPAPFNRVVVGIDFSPASLAGCRWALAHVAPGADALLAHVSLPDAPPSLSGGLDGFAATLDVAHARTAVRAGRPSDWLGTLAEEFDAALIAVGRRQDANRKRIGEANVVARLARRTRASVLVVPEGVVDAPSCVVAAIDDGPGSGEVIHLAATLADGMSQPLLVLHVLQPMTGAYDRVVHTRRHDITMAARGAVESVHGRLTLAVGDPAREIVAAGVARGGGLLVVGKRGADESPVGSLGSVARELLAKSPLPVLAIDVP